MQGCGRLYEEMKLYLHLFRLVQDLKGPCVQGFLPSQLSFHAKLNRNRRRSKWDSSAIGTFNFWWSIVSMYIMLQSRFLGDPSKVIIVFRLFQFAATLHSLLSVVSVMLQFVLDILQHWMQCCQPCLMIDLGLSIPTRIPPFCYRLLRSFSVPPWEHFEM